MLRQFDLVSDLHTEHYPETKWEPTSETLVVAGDTSNNPKRTRKVIEELSTQYQTVLFVDGNHEHYNTKWHSSNLRHLASDLPSNIHFLNNTSPSPNWPNVFGGNAWYDWMAPYDSNGKVDSVMSELFWSEMMNDSRYIYFDQGRPPTLASMFRIAFDKYMETAPKDIPIVVITHVPIIHAHLCYTGNPNWDRLNPSFTHYLMQDILLEYTDHKFVLCFGHTHTKLQGEFLNVQYYCNPRGYPHEATSVNYQPLLVEI